LVQATAGYRWERCKGEIKMDLKKILLERFEKKGIEPVLIPGLMKNILVSLKERPDITREEVSERLHFIGWNDFDLDENTLQIIIADYEASAPTHPAYM
jgi:hypothetical protein